MALSVSVAIQTHELRAEMATALLGCLDGDADLVFDPEPAEHASPWRTYRRALETAPPGVSHRFVLQDDTIVCDYFRDGLEAACAAQPDRVLAFFVAGHPNSHIRAFDWALNHGAPWAVLDNTTWLPVVATAWPLTLIGDLLGFVDQQFEQQLWPPKFTADDEICGRFLREKGINALASVPSLVEHPDTVHSIASGGRRQPTGLDATRMAQLWIGDVGCDPRGIDWTLPPAHQF